MLSGVSCSVVKDWKDFIRSTTCSSVSSRNRADSGLAVGTYDRGDSVLLVL